MCDLSDLEIRVLLYHKSKGCDYSKSLSRNFNINLTEAFIVHRKLFEMGFLEKVTSTLTKYKIDKHRSTIKHRNHTYYQLSKKGEHFLKKHLR